MWHTTDYCHSTWDFHNNTLKEGSDLILQKTHFTKPTTHQLVDLQFGKFVILPVLIIEECSKFLTDIGR